MTLQIKSTSEGDVGVIVGRFQAPELHPGHCDLIDTVSERHRKVLILVGSTPDVACTRRNSLDYYTRMVMIRERYPLVAISPLYDMPSDDAWSRSVDSKIVENFGSASAVLYGSRDAFIPHYNGRFPTVELEASKNLSGSAIRKVVSDEVRASADFRRGVIYAAYNRHPTAYPTVDIAVIDRKNEMVLLGRKAVEESDKWRFPGGFVDPVKDASKEDTVRRECAEEVGQIGVDPDSVRYVGSTRVDDWRYRREVDKIMTSLYTIDYTFGSPTAGDDLAQCRWFKFDELLQVVCETHRPLAAMLASHLKKEKK